MWNDFLVPLVFITSGRLETLPQGPTVFMGEYHTDRGCSDWGRCSPG